MQVAVSVPSAPGLRTAWAVVARALPCMPVARKLPQSVARDWEKHPALLDILQPPATLYAVSDIHGDPERLVRLLARHGVVRHGTAQQNVAWTGGQATLVVVGDSIDKGPSSLGAIDLLRCLEHQAQTAGGRVVALMGNHEAEFLADPNNKKAEADHGINREIRSLGLTPQAFAHGDNVRGQWLRNRAFGVRIGAWFFAHGGDTKGRSFPELSAYLTAEVNAQGFATPALVGHKSILRARAWWEGDASTGARYSAAIGTQHIVFGHDPSGLGPKGRIAQGQSGTLLRIDTGMSRGVDYSQGALLRICRNGNQESVHTCAADGEVELLWQRGILSFASRK